jgi:tetratricopeptide (TPR) repeat protein
VTSDPTQSAEDHYYAGIDFFGEGKLPEAIAEYTRALELEPDDILAWTTISRAYQRKGMVPEAEEAGNKARILGWKQQLKEQKASGGKA